MGDDVDWALGRAQKVSVVSAKDADEHWVVFYSPIAITPYDDCWAGPYQEAHKDVAFEYALYKARYLRSQAQKAANYYDEVVAELERMMKETAR